VKSEERQERPGLSGKKVKTKGGEKDSEKKNTKVDTASREGTEKNLLQFQELTASGERKKKKGGGAEWYSDIALMKEGGECSGETSEGAHPGEGKQVEEEKKSIGLF